MSGLSLYARLPATACTIFAAVFALAMPAPAESAGPFGHLAGNWMGAGTVTYGQGPAERIRCRANYNVGNAGTAVSLQLRCASDSYNFELQGNVRYQSGEVRGDWRENTRGAAGMVTGSIKGDRVDVRVEGQTFSAILSLVTRGDRQSIAIQAPFGGQMSSANITLNRRG